MLTTRKETKDGIFSGPNTDQKMLRIWTPFAQWLVERIRKIQLNPYLKKFLIKRNSEVFLLTGDKCTSMRPELPMLMLFLIKHQHFSIKISGLKIH